MSNQNILSDVYLQDINKIKDKYNRYVLDIFTKQCMLKIMHDFSKYNYIEL